MKFVLNGEDRTWEGNPDTTLLNWLREDEGLISPKDGCSSQGSCGCCMIQQDGKAMLSCMLPMKKVEGTTITTTDGLDEKLQVAIAEAFATKGGIQCGFCIPGFVMSARVLLQKNPDPTREEINKAINRNLCRCTGYIKIVDAIEELARNLREDKPASPGPGAGGVGTRLVKFDSIDTVLGFRPFVADMKFPGMLHGALKFSDHPRAVVKSIDTSKAEGMPGVQRIFTAADIPGERYVGLIVNDWPMMVAEGETTRYIGDVLAGVVADTDAQARAAVTAIEIVYEVLEPVTDVFEAISEDSPAVHERGNLLAQSFVERGGDVEQALAASDFVVERSFSTQRIEHAFMEPECCIALPSPDEEDLLIYSQGQGVFEDRKQIAQILGKSMEAIRVIQVQNGGAFGGKEDLSVQGHAALFAEHLQVPVKVTLTRDESIAMHPKRHPIQMEYKVGCNKEGRLTAIRADIIGDTGAYASVGMKVLERAVGHATSAYTVPVAWIRGRTVYTNNLPCGAMRGFGANQATFAMECCVDELCEMGGFDRWQFRYDNAIHNGDRTSTGQIIQGGAGVKATLEAVKDDFYKAKYAGLACGIKNTGIGNGMPDDGRIMINIEAPDKVVVYHGWTEMGQGVHTMAIQILNEETGIDPEIIDVRVDTRNASRLHVMDGAVPCLAVSTISGIGYRTVSTRLLFQDVSPWLIPSTRSCGRNPSP